MCLNDVTGANRYGLYSLLPGAGGGGYVTTTPATPGPPTPTRAYHATTHKGKFTTISSFAFSMLSFQNIHLTVCHQTYSRRVCVLCQKGTFKSQIPYANM